MKVDRIDSGTAIALITKIKESKLLLSIADNGLA